MDIINIEGGKKLQGTVAISGAKNAALPILAATLLGNGKSTIHHVPDLRDVKSMLSILDVLGAKTTSTNGTVEVDASGELFTKAPYELVSTMRASFCVLGPLLARCGKAEVSIPGGCVIGARPIDLHLKGLEALGAQIKIKHGYISAKAKELRGADIFLGGAFGSSVLATANVMMAATLAKGITRIENAACEPEVVDLALFLKAMGAKISGEGSHLIEIEGVKELKAVKYTVIPDRIETGTFMLAAAMTHSDIEITNVVPSHSGALIDKMRACGVSIETEGDKMRVKMTRKKTESVTVTTLAYPGFPTDLQAQMMAFMTITPGISVITEKIYPDRFIHIAELNRMGARIFLEGASAIVNGVPKLSGAPVMASDLRASAALVLAGLVADGVTEVSRVYHIDRGYERLEEKFSNLGAKIWRESR